MELLFPITNKTTGTVCHDMPGRLSKHVWVAGLSPVKPLLDDYHQKVHRVCYIGQIRVVATEATLISQFVTMYMLYVNH